MADFDYDAPGELFPGKRNVRMAGSVACMRFATAADAIRQAVEVLPAKSFLGTVLEVDEKRFDSGAIRCLYDSVEYPLARQPAAIADRLNPVKRASQAGESTLTPDSRADQLVLRIFERQKPDDQKQGR